MNSNEQQLTNITDFCEVSPCNNPDFSSGEFKKLTLDSTQKANMSMFFSQLPALAAGETMAHAYTVVFPPNLDATAHLMTYNDTGLLGTIIQRADGKIIDHAGLSQLSSEALVLKAFSVTSIATGQYFLTQINNEFKEINRKIDEILNFLYGNQKAELLSEISFVQFAHKNFTSIMNHDDQRRATIANLQAAKKIAMKDIELYMQELDGIVSKSSTKSKNKVTYSYKDFEELAESAVAFAHTLELSIQLYVTSGVMEAYYSENRDTAFITAIKEDMLYYVNRCENRIRNTFSTLSGHADQFGSNLLGKDKASALKVKLLEISEPLNGGEDSKMRKTVDKALEGLTREKKYCITSSGDVYLCT